MSIQQGDEHYDDLLAEWLVAGQPATFDRLTQASWEGVTAGRGLWRAFFPDGGEYPTFAPIILDDSYPRPLAQELSFQRRPNNFPVSEV